MMIHPYTHACTLEKPFFSCLSFLSLFLLRTHSNMKSTWQRMMYPKVAVFTCNPKSIGPKNYSTSTWRKRKCKIDPMIRPKHQTKSKTQKSNNNNNHHHHRHHRYYHVCEHVSALFALSDREWGRAACNLYRNCFFWEIKPHHLWNKQTLCCL